MLFEQAGIRGWVHSRRSETCATGALGLTHGAGSDCRTAFLVAVAEAFQAKGFLVLCYDLPFRQSGKGGFSAASQALDREGIRKVSAALRTLAPGVPLYMAGHSYGGRQTSMLAAEWPEVADALLLLSYPLHPPKQPEKLRREHFPSLKVPALFVHGKRDEFGTVAEVESARALIPARTALQAVDGAGHSLPPKFAAQIAEWFVTFTNK